MSFRLSGSKNVFEEIAEQYSAYIRLGVIADGEKLPSCRELAIELGINPNTVERAYSLLEKEGTVVTIPKKGTFAKKPRDSKEELIIEAEKQITALKQSGLNKDELDEIAARVYWT